MSRYELLTTEESVPKPTMAVMATRAAIRESGIVKAVVQVVQVVSGEEEGSVAFDTDAERAFAHAVLRHRAGRRLPCLAIP